MNVTAPASPFMRRKAARPREILEAAFELFAQTGYRDTKVEAIAAKAGVSKGTVFLYFHDKETLFQAVVRQHLTSLYSAWQQEITAYEGCSASLLLHAMQTWWNEIVCTRLCLISQMVWNASSHFPELVDFYQREVDMPGHDMLLQILQRGIAQGEFRPIPPQDALPLLLTPMVTVMRWPELSQCLCTSHPSLQPGQYLATQIQNCLRGLLVQPETFEKLEFPSFDQPPIYQQIAPAFIPAHHEHTT